MRTVTRAAVAGLTAGAAFAVTLALAELAQSLRVWERIGDAVTRQLDRTDYLAPDPRDVTAMMNEARTITADAAPRTYPLAESLIRQWETNR